MSKSRSKSIFVQSVLLCLGIASLIVLKGVNAQDIRPTNWPTMIPAKEEISAPIPKDNREVAILKLDIQADDNGKVTSVKLKGGVIKKSYAPNVVFDRTGPWTILLVSDNEKIQFGVLNPLFVEMEGEKLEDKWTGFYVTQITWSLVVPLFRNEKDLQVKEIKIFQENQEIYSVLVSELRK